jgi:hypothetical protein
MRPLTDHHTLQSAETSTTGFLEMLLRRSTGGPYQLHAMEQRARLPTRDWDEETAGECPLSCSPNPSLHRLSSLPV